MRAAAVYSGYGDLNSLICTNDTIVALKPVNTPPKDTEAVPMAAVLINSLLECSIV